MPSIIIYLLKVSISLAVLFIFYQLVLRKLTFYNWNRWYLLGYSILSFIIPFINITELLGKNNWEQKSIVRYVPSIDTMAPVTYMQNITEHEPVNKWEVLLVLLVLGSLLLISRLSIQYFSYRRLKQKAAILSSDGVTLYQVDEPIVPFSFGNAIFINQHQYNSSELQKIIRHELVHVQQRHSIDVLCSELICILNWYNPFAWLIKKAIRQNLEFIADNQVLQNGIDKKAYQYLLLNVVGNQQLSMGSSFNFSSLKKRIKMMNKAKSAQVHLVKFLFILPLLSVLLLAFRAYNKEAKVTYAIVFFDADTFEPLEEVAVKDVYRGTIAYSDETGYYANDYAVANKAIQVSQLQFTKKGYYQFSRAFNYTINNKAWNGDLVEFIALRKGSAAQYCKTCYSAFDGAADGNSGRQAALNNFQFYINQIKERVKEPVNNNAVPVIIDTVPKAAASGNEDNNLPEDYKAFLKRNPVVQHLDWTNTSVKVILKSGKIETYNRINKESLAVVEKKYGPLPTVPPPPPMVSIERFKAPAKGAKKENGPAAAKAQDMPADHKAFLKRNPSIRNFLFMTRTKTPAAGEAPYKALIIILKSGKEETVDLNSAAEVQKAENKYGELPAEHLSL